MRRLLLFLPFLLVISISYAQCLTITGDDTLINQPTTLCTGTYNVNDANNNGVIIINNNSISLDCNGSVIYGSGAIGINVNNHNNITISNCTVKNYDKGVYAYGSTSIYNSNFESTTGYKIGIDVASNNVLIDNASFKGLKYPIRCFGYKNITVRNVITNNTVDNDYTGAIYFYGSSNILLKNITCKYFEYACIKIANNNNVTVDGVFADKLISGTDNGFGIDGGVGNKNVTVSGLYFNGTTDHIYFGVWFSDNNENWIVRDSSTTNSILLVKPENSKNVTLYNLVSNNTKHSVWLWNVTDAEVYNVSAYNCDEFCFGIRSGSKNVYFHDNKNEGNRSLGVWEGASENLRVENNNFQGGLLVFTHNSIFKNNTFNGMEYYMNFYMSNNTSIVNNTFYNGNGFSIMYSTYMTLRNNTINDFSGSYFRVEGDSLDQYTTIDVDSSNLLAGNPIFYEQGLSDTTIEVQNKTVYCISCNNVTVLYNQHGGTVGLAFSNGRVEDSSFSTAVVVGNISFDRVSVKDGYSLFAINSMVNITNSSIEGCTYNLDLKSSNVTLLNVTVSNPEYYNFVYVTNDSYVTRKWYYIINIVSRVKPNVTLKDSKGQLLFSGISNHVSGVGTEYVEYCPSPYCLDSGTVRDYYSPYYLEATAKGYKPLSLSFSIENNYVKTLLMETVKIVSEFPLVGVAVSFSIAGLSILLLRTLLASPTRGRDMIYASITTAITTMILVYVAYLILNM